MCWWWWPQLPKRLQKCRIHLCNERLFDQNTKDWTWPWFHWPVVQIQFRLVVHEMSAWQNGPSDILFKRWSMVQKGWEPFEMMVQKRMRTLHSSSVRAVTDTSLSKTDAFSAESFWNATGYVVSTSTTIAVWPKCPCLEHVERASFPFSVETVD